MFEKYMICSQDFCNVVRNGQVTGFQLKLRINYYRGCYLSMIDSVRLVVDDEEFGHPQMSLKVGDRTYTFAELAIATTARWFFGDPAKLIVTKPGGLHPGMHTVRLGMFIRNSYVPRLDPQNLYDFRGGPRGPKGETHYGEPTIPLPLVATKKMTLVQ